MSPAVSWLFVVVVFTGVGVPLWRALSALERRHAARCTAACCIPEALAGASLSWRGREVRS